MKKVIMVFVGVVIAHIGFSQTVMPQNLRAESTLQRLGNYQGSHVPDMLYGIPMPPSKVIGDNYLNPDWQIGSVVLYEGDKLIEGFPIRYDIALNELEFNAKNGIKVLSGDKVKSFVWVNPQNASVSSFVNSKDFRNSDNVPLIGFFEVLSDGKLPLLKRTKLVVQKANYNVATSMGSTDDKILKSESLFYLKDNKVFKVQTSSKKMTPVFGNSAEEIKKFANDNSLSFSKEQDLIKIFNYHNSLAKK